MDIIKKFNDPVWRNTRERILVIRDGLLGDTVFITPLLLKLNHFFPNSEIDVVTGYRSPDILKNFPGINKIYRLPEKFSILKHLRLFISLAFRRYDIAFVQEVNSHYVLMAKVSRAKILIGYNNKLKKLLDFYIDRKGHAVLAEQQHLNELLNLPPSGSALFTSAEEDQEAEQYLLKKGIDLNKKLFCLQVTCSEPNSVREWIPERWAELADNLAKLYNAEIIFNGTSTDIPLIERVRQSTECQTVSVAGESSVRNLIAIVKRSEMVIGVDTGTLHIANALGVPLIMLMGYSVPEDTGPFDLTGMSKVLTGILPCIPCKYKDPKPIQWDYCVKNRPASCMDEIRVSDVLLAVSRLIKKVEKNKYH